MCEVGETWPKKSPQQNLSVKTHMNVECQSVNRKRFDWELSGEIMVRNRECLRLGKSAIFHSRYSKWKLVAICLKWEIKDVASVLLLVKQTFVSFPYKTSPSHKSKDLVQSRLSIQALINDLWEAWEKTEATYIYLNKHYIHNKNRPQKKKKSLYR